MRPFTRLVLILAVLAVLLPACQPAAPAWTDVKDPSWWKDAAFYEIFVRSFYDSNGDGIGDLQGIIQKLDYLNDGDPQTHTDLGVTGIWLMPINPSPSYHGYDVTDYYNVNPQYGTLDDMRALVSEAHKRGMKIIIDLVLNHTSVTNPWFVAANNGDPQYRDWYIWADKNPGYKGPWGEDVWHMGKTGYYYGIFTAAMPDLNYNNPAVTAEMDKIASFWLKDVGIDGFREDAAKHIIEDGTTQENTPATLAWLKTFQSYDQSINPQVMTVGEIQSGTDAIAAYVQDQTMDLAFNFPLAADMVKSANDHSAFSVSNSLATSQRAFQPANQYASFLTNHDQPRLMTQLRGDLLKAKTAASLLLTAPGVPFLYYGEEIGMTGDKPDEKIRRPFQWSEAPNAGFTANSLPWMLVSEDYKTTNVAVEEKDPASLLNHYRSLLAVRSEHYALRTGSYVQVSANNPALYAALRVADNESVLVLVNMGTEPQQDIRLTWNASSLKGSPTALILMGSGKINPLNLDERGGAKDYAPGISLAPGETVIIQYRP